MNGPVLRRRDGRGPWKPWKDGRAIPNHAVRRRQETRRSRELPETKRGWWMGERPAQRSVDPWTSVVDAEYLSFLRDDRLRT